ncbi:MAG: flagellin [Alphaproteobacteria bacterium]|nr:flagellin [Alphaproteobacteria bacterium]
MSDVVLSSALRANLLSLQSTQRLIDSTQQRLATGLKVSSALDNPQNFFTSQALSNRSSDLTRLLDGIGQSIRTIEAADKGISALTNLVTQANSVAQSARDELAATSGTARAVGNVDLRNVTDITAGAFATAGIANNDTIQFVTTNDAGAQIAEIITITTGDSAYTLAAKITDAFADNRAGEIKASINSTTGFLEIESKGGRTFRFGDNPATAVPVTTAGYTALGLGRYVEDQNRQNGAVATNVAGASIVAGNTIKTISLYEASNGSLLDAGDTIVGTTLNNAAGTAVVTGLLATDKFSFQVNNGAAVTLTLAAGTTYQDLIDTVNENATVNTQIRLGFDSLTGQITLTSLSDAVENVSFTFQSVAAGLKTLNIGLGDTSPTQTLDPYNITQAGINERVISFNSSTAKLDNLAKDYNSLRTQINDLVKDAQYRGVNLLQGDNLTTFFNEDNSSRLVTTGGTFTADGLGLTVATFASTAAAQTSITQTSAALETVRAFGSTLANNLSIIQTRRDFTEGLINTLDAGASDLTKADENEEGANLLALQTRQQLGVTSLSLASQAQQSVLRLF